MEKNNDRSKFLQNIAENFEKCMKGNTDKSKGCIVIAYDSSDGESMQNAYMGAGKPTDLAESLLGCMKQDQMLANLVLAAGAAYSNAMALEYQKLTQTDKPAN